MKSWASLVEKTALEGIPVHERKRQEAIFELIHTEVAYVRDLQLIVEVCPKDLLQPLVVFNLRGLTTGFLLKYA